MQIFYTVISEEGTSQPNPLYSLGGFKSSSPVPNNVFNSLFQDISLRTEQESRVNYIALILQNDSTTNTVSDLSIWIPEVEGSVCTYRIALVQLNDNNEMESIPSPSSKPLFVPESEWTSGRLELEFEGMDPGDQLGIWIEQTLDESALAQTKNCQLLFEQFEKGERPSTVETQTLNIYFEYGARIVLSTVEAVYEVGESIQISVVNQPSDVIEPLIWTSNTPSVASVDQTGLVQALAPGQVQIQVVSQNNIKGYCTFLVE